MMDNTARTYETAPQYQSVPKKRPLSTPAVRPHHQLNYRLIERCLTAACGFAILAFAIVFLMCQNHLASLNRSYQDTQSEIRVQRQKIADAKQSIGELSDSRRLATFAAEKGYKVIEGNIRRVTE